MRITESRLRRMIRSVIAESSDVLTESHSSKYDFIDDCDLNNLKQGLSIYERTYLINMQGDENFETLHKFLSDWCQG